MTRRLALVTAVVASLALLLQLVLVVDGASVLVSEDPPGLWTRLGRFVSYFTIQSNLLVAAGCWMLARRPDVDTPALRAIRLAGLIGITVTGLVHFVLLRPLLDLDGWSWVADKLLHVAVPLLAVGGWIVGGPRGRIDPPAVRVTFLWPLIWLGWTLGVGAASDWFPYPFLDFREEGWGSVLLTCLGVLVLFSGLVVLAVRGDRRLRSA